MASCSPPGKTQGSEWGVSPRRLLSTGQPRTANLAGKHDTSAKKASPPRHCTCTSLRGPTQVPPPGVPPLQFDCPSRRRHSKIPGGPEFPPNSR